MQYEDRMREIRAVMDVLGEWSHYLKGRAFCLETDTESIAWVIRSKYMGQTYFEWGTFLE